MRPQDATPAGSNRSSPATPAGHAGAGRAGAFSLVLLGIVAAATLWGAAVPEAGAEPATARLLVSATVKRWHKVDVAGSPSAVQVTAADIQRGYVDLAESTRLLVRSNARNSYRLEVINLSVMVRAMDLVVRNETYSLGAEGGGIPLQGTTVSPARDDFEVRYRLYLADGVAPGTYPWQPTVSLTVL